MDSNGVSFSNVNVEMPMIATKRTNILGVGISALNLKSAVSRMEEAAEMPGLSGFVTITGVHGVTESQRDPELRKIHNRSLYSTPDGMPMVWLSRWNGNSEVDRVYGPDLMLEMFRASEVSGHRHYFFGGADGVADQLAEKLGEKFPEAEIVGRYTPPFRPLEPSEEEELVRTIRETRPHFFWVGLSTPKQERFMSGLLEKYPDLTSGWDHGFVMFGVGAAFDFHAGLVRQAPRWIQRSGLEWLFRVCMEPRRLWKRYLVGNTTFVRESLKQMTDWRDYPIER